MTLLELTAAFDSVDHTTVIERLRVSYGLDEEVLSWFVSYLTDRSKYVRTSGSRSASSAVLFGVPQGSVLGPILFLLYTAHLLQLIKRHQLCHMHTQMTLRSMVFVSRQRPLILLIECRPVWLLSRIGWDLIGCCSTPRRQRCFGVRRDVANIYYPLE